MNPTSTLRAGNCNPDVLPSSRRICSRRRVRFSTVALEHVSQEQQQQIPSKLAISIPDEEQQYMRCAVEASWQVPCALRSSAADLHALSSPLACLQPQLVRTRRARKPSDAAGKHTIHPRTAVGTIIGSRLAESVDFDKQLTHSRTSSSSSSGSTSSRSKTSNTSSSRSARLTDSSSPRPADATVAVVEDEVAQHIGATHANALKVLLGLWHLHVQHNAASSKEDSWRSPVGITTIFRNEPARLLTAAEEAALGSIVQQHRKLLQLYREWPDAAAKLGPPPPSLQQWLQQLNTVDSAAPGSPASGRYVGQDATSREGNSNSSDDLTRRSSSGAAHASSDVTAAAASRTSDGSSSSVGSTSSSSISHDIISRRSSSSSSSSSTGAKTGRKRKSSLHGQDVHGNTRWPPPLSQSDLDELLGTSAAWRTLLPELAPKAQQLLVVFNTRLVCHMLRFCRRSGVPSEDLLAAGLAGLQVAAERYDPARNTRFSTTASAWILQRMQRASDSQQGSYRTPHQYSQMLRYVLAKYGAAVLSGIEQRPHVLQEVADHFGTKPGSVLFALEAITKSAFATSLDAVSDAGMMSSKGTDHSVLPLAAMLTSTDLDEDSDAGPSSTISTGLAGSGSFNAAAGQLPHWMPKQQQVQVTQLDDAADGLAMTEEQIDALLQVLKPRERAVVLMLYGDTAGGLGQAAGQQAATAGMVRKVTIATPGSTGADRFKSKEVRVVQGSMRLSAVAKQMGMTVEGVRQIRNTALRKLQLAAEAAAQLAHTSNGFDFPAEQLASAVHRAAAPQKPPGSIQGAISACMTRSRRPLRLLHAYYAEHGRLPEYGVCVGSSQLGSWCSRQYWKHVKHPGSVSPQLLHALELIVPGWVERMEKVEAERLAQASGTRKKRGRRPSNPALQLRKQ